MCINTHSVRTGRSFKSIYQKMINFRDTKQKVSKLHKQTLQPNNKRKTILL
ncbi:hypothetical protein HC081234_21940 [Helicobacter cinaedi]|nr:hypothetical protein HC081234_21940 [Helicobacter cinaedi]